MENKYLDLFKNKERICLRDKLIIDKEIPLICEALDKNPTLTKIDLSYNRIMNEGVEILAKNTTLRILNLNGNSFNCKGIKALAENTTIEILKLNYNRFYDEDLGILAKNTTLKELYLYFGFISDEGAMKFLKNTTLRKLDLSGNDITIEMIKKINIHIYNNNKRQKLSILTTKVINDNNVNIPDFYPRILLKY